MRAFNYLIAVLVGLVLGMIVMDKLWQVLVWPDCDPARATVTLPAVEAER